MKDEILRCIKKEFNVSKESTENKNGFDQQKSKSFPLADHKNRKPGIKTQRQCRH